MKKKSREEWNNFCKKLTKREEDREMFTPIEIKKLHTLSRKLAERACKTYEEARHYYVC